MKTYRIKGEEASTMRIEKDLGESYMVVISRNREFFEETITENMSKELFDMCLRTGYLVENIPATA
jgi:hypothetical protein